MPAAQPSSLPSHWRVRKACKMVASSRSFNFILFSSCRLDARTRPRVTLFFRYFPIVRVPSQRVRQVLALLALSPCRLLLSLASLLARRTLSGRQSARRKGFSLHHRDPAT